MNPLHSQFAVHNFDCLKTTSFCPKEYSLLKFGVKSIAKKFAVDLADNLFTMFSGELLSNRCVVIPSPYNHVANAATVVTKHFVDRLNHHLVKHGGEHCDYSTIHRKVSYIKDYGFLPAEQRKKLIDGDDFYFNPEFYRDKIIIFVDDVRITGTHEIKLVELMKAHGIQNRSIFAYYAMYHGDQADIEAEINFASIKNSDDFVRIVQNESDFNLIVRPIKFILGSLNTEKLFYLLSSISRNLLSELYHGCLGEGYYKIPDYQRNFQTIENHYELSN